VQESSEDEPDSERSGRAGAGDVRDEGSGS